MYLYHLYRESKLVFGLICVFMLGTAVCSLGHKVVFPFFCWNFFASGTQFKPEHTMLNVVINECDTVKFSELPLVQSLFLHDQLYAIWLPMMRNKYEHPLVSELKQYPNFEQKKAFLPHITNDSTAILAHYPVYLKHYLQETRRSALPIRSLKIVEQVFLTPRKGEK